MPNIKKVYLADLIFISLATVLFVQLSLCDLIQASNSDYIEAEKNWYEEKKLEDGIIEGPKGLLYKVIKVCGNFFQKDVLLKCVFKMLNTVFVETHKFSIIRKEKATAFKQRKHQKCS